MEAVLGDILQKARTTAALCYIPPISGNDSPRNDSFRREKRGLLAFLGGSVVSLGKQRAEIKSINKNVVGFENQKDITEKVSYFFKIRSCSQFYSAFALKLKHNFWESMTIIDTL